VETNGRQDRSARALLVLALFAAPGLRWIEAARKSLWLDELHSLFTAGGADLAEVIERVRVDFHPPGYFVLLHLLREADPHAQRALSVAFSLAAIPFLLGLARSAGFSPLARAVTVFLYATAPYQILYGAELRAYSGLSTAAVVMAWAAFTPGRGKALAFALALALGLYLHYFALVAAAAVVLARLLVRPRTGGLLAPRRLILAGALGAALFLPWVLAKERWILTDPGKLWRREHLDTTQAPGPRTEQRGLLDQDFTRAAVILPRSYVPMIGSLGGVPAGAARVAAVAFFALAAAGLVALVRRGRGPPSSALGGILAAAGLAYALLLVACLLVWRRVPDQYFVVGAWGWMLLVGACVDAFARARAAFAGLMCAASLALGASHVAGAPREDVRSAVETAVSMTEEGHTLTAVLWQPPWYPDRLPFDVYARGVEAREPGEVPVAEGGVVVLARSAPPGRLPEKWRAILEGRRVVREIRIDAAMSVYLLEPE